MKSYHLFTKPNEKALKIGDYVVCRDKPGLTDPKSPAVKHIAKNIGQLVNIDNKDIYQYTVKYPPLEGLKTNLMRCFNRDEIIDFSSNKEDLEYFITSNNYNL